MAESLLDIGTIVGTHGLRGDLKVRLKSGDPDVLMAMEQIHLLLPTGEALTVDINRRVLHKGQVLLRLSRYDTINLAEPLIGAQVLIDKDNLPELDGDQYYWGDLKGIAVVDRDRGELGRLVHLFTSAAHDTYVVKGPFGEILIPAVRQFILDVDLDDRMMQVVLPDGLIPEHNDL